MRKTVKTREANGPRIACALSTPELRLRKDTILAQPGERMIGKTALAHGYAYHFDRSDDTPGQWVDFIRSERVC